MATTYIVGAIGVFIGFKGLSSNPPTMRWGTLLAVGGGGVLSFVRHSLLHRSDAARMRWDLGRRNNFQIEVGLANLAWGLAAIIVVALNLPIATQAAVCLTMGIYLFAVFVMQLLFPGGQRRGIGPLIGIGTFGAVLIIMGGMGLAAA